MAVSVGGVLWRPLLWALPLLGIALAVPLIQAVWSARRATSHGITSSRRVRILTTFLHLMQPLARTMGRGWIVGGRGGRNREAAADVQQRPAVSESAAIGGTVISVWHESWQSNEHRLETMERTLRANGARVARGGAFDRWDLEVRGGHLGAARLRMTIEEHGSGKQMARFRVWPRWSAGALAFIGLSAALAALTATLGCWIACVAAACLTTAALARAIHQSRAGIRSVRSAARTGGE
jgi:hypothetical protein